MELLLTPNLNTLCRICLTSSQNSIFLTNPIKEKVLNFNENWPIVKMLEIVISTKVFLNNEKLPSKICQMCLSLLKIAYEFQTQFKNSESKLRKVIGDRLEDDKEERKPLVELISGNNRFDLNDVLIIEEENEEKSSYDGFLRNLGNEISAKFVSDKKCESRVETSDNIVSIIPLFEKNEIVSLSAPIEKGDLSQFIVKKYPNESKIVVTQKNNQCKTVKTLYECPLCDKILQTKNDLDFHKTTKHSSSTAAELLICDKCGHIAKTQSQLYHHLRTHNPKRFKCDQCHKLYDTWSHLKIHLEVHKNQKPFLCNICGKNFNYAMSLRYHLRLHDDKKFTCNICNEKFRMNYTLKRHLRTHTKDKPYSCNYCLKKFSSRGEQSAHEMLHTGLRPYKCEYCGKGYVKLYNLKVHYLTHPGDNECHLCSKTFIDMKFLKMHLGKVHNETV